MDYQELIEFRKALHKNPELSGLEIETAAKIHTELQKLQPDLLLKNLGGHGVLALFNAKGEQKTVFFRAELDALPIEELNEFAHKSIQKGLSHKCGHDGHSTILLGLAKKVAKERSNLGVNIGIIFQPAEETGKGAVAVLSAPQFQVFKPDYIFALHNLPGYHLHSVVLKNEAFTPSVKSLVFCLTGKTAHAAEPENGINPALAVAEILQGANDLSSNSLEDLALITPIHVTMGKPAYGISAGYAELHFTLRSYTPRRMNELESELKALVMNSVSKYGLILVTNSLEEFHANMNNATAVDFIRKAAVLQKLELIELDVPMKWGEDFGAFTQQFSGAIFGLGAGESCPALHNPDYDFPDALIETGVNLFWKIIEQVQQNR